MRILTGVLVLTLASSSPGIVREGVGQIPPTSWELVPELTISGGEEPFGRIVDVEVIGDRIFVLDKLARAVSVYSLDGEHRSTFGREGEGPGEFSASVSTLLRSDKGGSLLVVDGGNERLTEFDANNDPVRSWHLPRTDGLAVRWGSFGKGVILRQIHPFGFAIAREESQEEGGVKGITLQSLSLDSRNEAWETVVEFDIPSPMDISGSWAMKSTRYPEAPIWAPVGNGHLAVGTSDAYQFAIIGLDGDSIGELGRSVGRRGISSREKRRILDDFAHQTSERGDVPGWLAKAFVKGMEVADSLPVVQRILSGDAGSMLVRRGLGIMDPWTPDGRSPLEPSAGAPDWDYFDSSGEFRGVVTVPSWFSPLRIRDGRIYGIGWDEYDVTSLVVCSLRER